MARLFWVFEVPDLQSDIFNPFVWDFREITNIFETNKEKKSIFLEYKIKKSVHRNSCKQNER